ncbi:meiosis-specific coiled-coil domain-containing protein MEIOC isoform X2 [Pseudophryne corroboree]
MHHSYEFSIPTSSCNYSTNYADSSLFYAPWSTYPDEMKQAASTQLKSKIQAEKNEYGSEADLYGLVSNILDETEKTQPYFSQGICSPTMKSVWSLNMNRLSDHEELLHDITQAEDLAVLQQNVYGTESMPSTETQQLEDLYHDLEQDGHWLSSCHTDNHGSCNLNPKMSIQEFSLPKNGFTVSAALPETSKDCFQKRDSLVSPLNKYNFDTELGRYDMINHGKTKQSKCSVFQDFKNCTNVSSEFSAFDAEAYARFFQAKQNIQRHEDFLLDQNNTAAKVTQLMTARPFPKDSLFASEYDHKTDYGVKTLCGGSSAFVNHLQKLNHIRHDLQNSDYFKSASLMSSTTSGNSNKSSWLNGHSESNSHSTYCNQKLNSVLSNSQRNPTLGSSYSSVACPLTPTRSFQKYSNVIPTVLPFEYSFNSTDRAQDRFGKTREELMLESISEKKLKPLNGVCEKLSSHYNPLNSTVKKIPEKKQSMQCNVDEHTYDSVAHSYKELLGSLLNYNNQRPVSGDKPLNGSKLTHHQDKCFSNGLMMGDIHNNFTTQSSNNCRSHFSHNLGNTIYPIMDNYDPYPYEDLGQVCPRLNDLLHGDASIRALVPMFSTQRSMKPRSIPAGELHFHLEECYEQCRALEKERKRTESVLVKHYPGKKVSSTNNTPIPRLTANPSRVDRLIVDQLREQARVATLLGKMERFRSSPLHANISTAIDRYLEAIHSVQTHRKDEIANTSNRQKHSRPRHHDDRDIFILASSIKDMATATRKARTALWCALQMTLPKLSPAQNTGDIERVLQTIGNAQDKG